jgi:hypothetical protein
MESQRMKPEINSTDIYEHSFVRGSGMLEKWHEEILLCNDT